MGLIYGERRRKRRRVADEEMQGEEREGRKLGYGWDKMGEGREDRRQACRRDKWRGKEGEKIGVYERGMRRKERGENWLTDYINGEKKGEEKDVP